MWCTWGLDFHAQVLVQAICNGSFSQLLLYYIGGTKRLLHLTRGATFRVWGPPGPCCCCRVPYACGFCNAQPLGPSHLKVRVCMGAGSSGLVGVGDCISCVGGRNCTDDVRTRAQRGLASWRAPSALSW